MSTTTFSGPVASQNGFIENSFTTTERDAIADPQEGLLIYNTTTNTYEVYNGTAWQDAFGGGPADNTYRLGIDYTSGGVTGINQFGGHLIQVDSTKWGNPADAVSIVSQPIGTLLTFEVNGGTHTATTQTSNPGGNNVSVLFNDNPGFLYGTTLDSISFISGPAPSGTIWGTSAWTDNDYSVNSIDVGGTGSPGPSDFSFMGMSPETRDVLLAYPIGTVFTVVHGTGITAGDTFTLTSQFSGGGGMYQANATYAGGGYMVGMAFVTQFSVE
jgi:hypothetical protein